LATERRTDAPTDVEIQIQIQTYTGTHKKRTGTGGEKERKKKEAKGVENRQGQEHFFILKLSGIGLYQGLILQGIDPVCSESFRIVFTSRRII
jgi:hypothetical protein